jgi:hypothetical protein
MLACVAHNKRSQMSMGLQGRTSMHDHPFFTFKWANKVLFLEKQIR